MNEKDLTSVPPLIVPSADFVPPPGSANPRPLLWWLRKFLACNPFYLASAALLLYGCYRVSIDASLLHSESARLWFNFSSVQVYEILLVLVAIFLARRRLWYDSTLLVGLENLLVFVPFILISQAALTGAWTSGTMCAAGVTLAVLRFGCLKKYFTQLNLPGRLLGVGFILLAVNVALPLVYRHYINFKIGVHLDSGPDYVMNECNWLLVLPAVLALANFLPRARAGGDLLPQHRWLPAGLFSLWFLVTCVHLYGLDYVYGYYLRSELLAPAAWVLAWTIWLRCPAQFARIKYALLIPAISAPLLATSPGADKTYLVLSALNIAGYGAVALLDRRRRMALHLACASTLLLVAGLPNDWVHGVTPDAAPAQWVAAGLAAYMIFWTAWLKNPKLAILGSVICGSAIMVVFRQSAGAGHWALQGAFMFFLLHSLRWNDREHPDANTVRMLTGLAWGIASFVWVNSEGGRFWMPFIPGAAVLGIYCVCLPCRGKWRLAAVPAAAMLVMLSGPCSAAVQDVRSAPVGLLAVVASLLLLGLGTVAALTRELWHKQ